MAYTFQVQGSIPQHLLKGFPFLQNDQFHKYLGALTLLLDGLAQYGSVIYSFINLGNLMDLDEIDILKYLVKKLCPLS